MTTLKLTSAATAFGMGNRMIDNPKVPRRVFNNPSAQNCCNDLMNVDYGQTSVWWHHYILGATLLVLMVCTNPIIQHDGIKSWCGLWAPTSLMDTIQLMRASVTDNTLPSLYPFIQQTPRYRVGALCRCIIRDLRQTSSGCFFGLTDFSRQPAIACYCCKYLGFGDAHVHP